MASDVLDEAIADLRAGAFDTSTFLESEAYAGALGSIRGRASKDKKHRAYQRAFEDWLIENPC